MTTFSTVLGDLAAATANDADFSLFAELVVVRDLKGVVRLAGLVRQPPPSRSKLQSVLTRLESALASRLGAWFAGPVMSDAHSDPLLTAVAGRLRAEASSWVPIDTAGNALPGKWYLLERRLTKDAWATSSPASPPWELKGSAPPIVAFYSFKGGVGRTTALAATAFQLARAGKQVAVVDLDLEAPGLGPFFGVAPVRGVIDVLVDHRVTGAIDLNGASARPAVDLGGAEKTITVFPAGASLDDEYLEKLGRLDFSRAAFGSTVSPTAAALTELLKALAKDHDLVLLDARAGLHDLGGLAMQGLAHVDVVVARPSGQTTAGMKLALKHLRAVRGEDTQVVVAHGQAPASNAQGTELTDFQDKIYELFSELVYSPDPPPSLDDADAMHRVVALPQDPRLGYLRDGGDALQAFDSGIFADFVGRLEERIELVREP